MQPGPDVKVNYAADELGNAAVDAAKNPTSPWSLSATTQPAVPTWRMTGTTPEDGGGTLACTVPSDGREGRDRESHRLLTRNSSIKQVFAANPKTVVVLVSSFPFRNQLDPGERPGDPSHGALLAG